MIRVAFLGCDSTHTEAFASRINQPGAPFYGRARVSAIWGEDSAQAAAKASALGIERVAATPADALADADLAMVIGRFGEGHYGPTIEAVKAGLPTFVDKPFTVNIDEARRLAEFARERHVPLGSASPLRFAKEVSELKDLIAGDGGWECIISTVPANCTDLGPDPRLNSAFFYGIHGLEMLLELTGHDIVETSVSYGGSAISVRFDFAAGRSALFNLVRNAPEFYEISAYTKASVRRVSINLDGSYYEAELEALLGSFALGRDFVPLDSTLAAIALLDRIEREDPFKAARS